MVPKKHRGRKVAAFIMNESYKLVGKNNYVINAVENQVSVSRNMGLIPTFQITVSIGKVVKRNISHVTCSGVTVHVHGGNTSDDKRSVETHDTERPITKHRVLDESDLADLVKYDANIHTVARPVFLKYFLSPAVVTTLIARRGNDIVGYACVQPVWENTRHIGPVFADEDAIGKMLLNNILNIVPNETEAVIAFPAQSSITINVLENHKFVAKYHLTRMHKTTPIDLPLEKVFTITETDTSLI